MKIYFYETNGYDGILIAHAGKWVSFTNSDKIDGMYCNADNAAQIAANLRNGWENGGFDSNDFRDWHENAGYRSNPANSVTAGTNPAAFLSECENYREI